MKKKLYIYGVQPVLELIESGKQIDSIFLQNDIKTTWSNEIKTRAKKYDINIKLVPRFKLNRLSKKNHQGIIATTSSVVFQNFENLLSSIYEKGEFPLFLLLDRITDVRNFGSICRSAEAMGVHGIIIPKKGAAQINEITIKASSGAINNINICRENNLENVIKISKKSGITVLGCSEKSDKNIFDINLNKPLIIIIGSEKDGISKQLLRLCNDHAKIPLYGKTKSLNASVATGIILFEYQRQAKVNLRTC